MDIKPFAVEEWMNKYESGAKYNIAETCVDSISMDQLFALTGEDKPEFLDRLCARRLTYGDIDGLPEFLDGVWSLYGDKVEREHIVPTHGAAGANHLAFWSLISPGDRVISVTPTYQQLQSIPASLGADVDILQLRPENGFLPDLRELYRLAGPGTKMIVINNPNNPTGALMDTAMLNDIAEIADSVGAWVLCDEVYRRLNQVDAHSLSIADLYEKGVSVGSMSKAFSLAGIRLGWIVTRSDEALKLLRSHRDYDLISCGVFDEMLAAVALRHAHTLLERSRRIVRENLAVLDAWVASEPRVWYVKPRAGTTALIFYTASVPSYEFCEGLYKETGVFVTPGDCFGIPYSFRVGYAYGKQALVDGLAAISAYLDKID